MKKHENLLLLAKAKMNSIEVFIYRALINPYISHDEFTLVNNVLRVYNDMKEEIKNLAISTVHQRL